MWIQAGALAPVPAYAVVSKEAVARVLQRLTTSGALQSRLDEAFRVLEREQPALAGFLAAELSDLDHQAAQALGYFLFLVGFLSFREEFGARIGSISDAELQAALCSLVADGEVRERACRAGSYSEDALSIGQPALMALVHGEIDLAPEQTADFDPVLQTLLVGLVALTDAVAPGA
jgi:hypothetical protein